MTERYDPTLEMYEQADTARGIEALIAITELVETIVEVGDTPVPDPEATKDYVRKVLSILDTQIIEVDEEDLLAA